MFRFIWIQTSQRYLRKLLNLTTSWVDESLYCALIPISLSYFERKSLCFIGGILADVS